MTAILSLSFFLFFNSQSASVLYQEDVTKIQSDLIKTVSFSKLLTAPYLPHSFYIFLESFVFNSSIQQPPDFKEFQTKIRYKRGLFNEIVSDLERYPWENLTKNTIIYLIKSALLVEKKQLYEDLITLVKHLKSEEQDLIWQKYYIIMLIAQRKKNAAILQFTLFQEQLTQQFPNFAKIIVSIMYNLPMQYDANFLSLLLFNLSGIPHSEEKFDLKSLDLCFLIQKSKGFSVALKMQAVRNLFTTKPEWINDFHRYLKIIPSANQDNSFLIQSLRNYSEYNEENLTQIIERATNNFSDFKFFSYLFSPYFKPIKPFNSIAINNFTFWSECFQENDKIVDIFLKILSNHDLSFSHSLRKVWMIFSKDSAGFNDKGIDSFYPLLSPQQKLLIDNIEPILCVTDAKEKEEFIQFEIPQDCHDCFEYLQLFIENKYWPQVILATAPMVSNVLQTKNHNLFIKLLKLYFSIDKVMARKFALWGYLYLTMPSHVQ